MKITLAFPTSTPETAQLINLLRSVYPDVRIAGLEERTRQLAARTPPGPSRERKPLTERQHEILEQLASNMPIKQIAEKMALSHHTINNHTRTIYRKLAVASRAGAIAYYFTHHKGQSSPALK